MPGTNNILGTNKLSLSAVNTSWSTNQFMVHPTSSENTSSLGSWLPGYFSQKSYVSRMNPSVITLGIGGNDMGFSSKIEKCVSPLSENECYSSYEDRYELVTEIYNQYDKLVKTYQEVKRTAAPGTKVYVTGYPYLADTSGEVGCGKNVWLNANELKVANTVVAELNLTIERAAGFAGVKYVDVSGGLEGYRLCERLDHLTAVNGMTAGDDFALGTIGRESFHPNQLGHQLLKSAIKTETSNLTAAMPTPSSASTKPIINTSDSFFSVAADSRTIRKTIQEANQETLRVNLTEQLEGSVDGSKPGLRANTSYTIELHSTPTSLGTFTSDDIGNLDFTATIPNTVEPGVHTLHIFGTNVDGQAIDIYRTINVGYSATDFDGDGINDDVDECNLPLSEEDLDEDGLDDACDPVIGDPVLPDDEEAPLTYWPVMLQKINNENKVFGLRKDYENIVIA